MILRGSAYVAALALVLAPSYAGAQKQADPSLLTLDRIFGGEFRPDSFGPFRWLGEGVAYTTLEASPSIKGSRDVVRYETKTGKRSVLVPAEKLKPAGQTTPLSIDDYAWSEDGAKLLIFTNSQRVWRQNTRGDYWVLELKSAKLTKLGGDSKPATLMFAKFSPDGARVGYVRENNLYTQELADGKITPLTSDGSATLINGTADWVNEEELYIRDAWRWSLDSSRIAYWQFNTEGVPIFTLINDTDSLYPRLHQFAYPKAGQKNSAVRVGTVSAQGGPTTWVELPGEPREHYIAWMEWADNSTEVVVQQLNRLQNLNQVFLAEARTGRSRLLLAEHDGAWVDVPATHSLDWFDDGSQFTWVSERDGWRHVYAVSRDGSTVRRVTSGNYDVLNVVHVDASGGWVYFEASPANVTQSYLYRMALSGQGSPERLTPSGQPGSHGYEIAPDGAWAVHRWSAFGAPPRSELIQLPSHQLVRPLVENTALRKKVQALQRGVAEFVRVDIGEGVALDAFLMKPPRFDATRRYPLLFHVYGEPAATTVRDAWDRDYLWHLMLTQQGYLVASVDNRGTPQPRGRDWRKCVYRKIGVLTSHDQAGAARVLSQRPYVDPARVGIWGWSGGGSSSLNAIFRYPDIYHLAMAVAPVPDIRLYDTIYQERYIGLPQENASDYSRCSPITFAGQLKGDLLVVHGTGDDNVHYQGTEKLVDALVAANKPFTMMAYPNRTHAIREGKNTTRHLYELLTRYLHDHLPPGPK
jgi:dipeptidyl-peptidase-4